MSDEIVKKLAEVFICPKCDNEYSTEEIAQSCLNNCKEKQQREVCVHTEWEYQVEDAWNCLYGVFRICKECRKTQSFYYTETSLCTSQETAKALWKIFKQ